MPALHRWNGLTWLFATVAGTVAFGCEDQATLGTGPAEQQETSSLIGTWDVIATDLYSKPRTYTFVITEQSLEVTSDEERFEGELTGDAFSVSYLSGERLYSASGVRQRFAALPLGALPFALGGSWEIRGEREADCSARLDPGTMWAQCNGTRLPRWVPNLSSDTLSVERTSALPSMFGELGGIWTVTTTRGTRCTFNVHNSSARAQCAGKSLTGTFEIAFDGGTASGRTSTGVEISARRR